MRTHGACSDCQKPLTCAEVIWVYRNSVGIHPTTGALWCPVCLLMQGGFHEAARELLEIDCRACAGAAGAATARDILTSCNFEYTSIATSMYFCYVGDAGVAVTAIFTAPGGRVQAPIPTITLEPGEIRCSCNICERLVVRA